MMNAFISVTVQKALTGERLGILRQIPASSLGGDLMVKVQQRFPPPANSGVRLCLLDGSSIDPEYSLNCQNVCDSVTINYILVPGGLEKWKADLKNYQTMRKSAMEATRKEIGVLLNTSEDISYASIVSRLTYYEIEQARYSLQDVLSCLRRLVEVGRTSTLSCLLCHAARCNAVETRSGLLGVRELLDSQVNPSTFCELYSDEGGTALHVAVAWARPRVAKELILAGAKPDTVDPHGDTPLLKAALSMTQLPSVPHPCMPANKDLSDSSVLEVVKLLLDEGAKINHQGFRGETALLRACSESLPRLAKFLIAAGANVDLPDNLGECPLHHAARRCKTDESAKLLLEANANVNARCHKGLSPLMGAVQMSRLQNVRTLLAAGGSVQAAGSTVTGNVFLVCQEQLSQNREVQSKILSTLIGSNYGLFLASREDMMEKAAEEADTDFYNLLESWQEPSEKHDSDSACSEDLRHRKRKNHKKEKQHKKHKTHRN